MKREIAHSIRIALKEDQAGNDVTSRLLVGNDARSTAVISAKQAGVACGIPFAAEVFRRMDPRCKVRLHATDGTRVRPGQKLLSVNGKISKLLAA